MSSVFLTPAANGRCYNQDMFFTALWIAWLAIFVIIEAAAIIRKAKGDTLSEHTWDWFCLTPNTEKTPWCVARRVTFLAFWAWLTIHFFFGGTWV